LYLQVLLKEAPDKSNPQANRTQKQDGKGMFGTGLVFLNMPGEVLLELEQVLPWLTNQLSGKDNTQWEIKWLRRPKEPHTNNPTVQNQPKRQNGALPRRIILN